MFKVNDLEAVFLPEEAGAEKEWIAEMEARGFVMWEAYSPVCKRIQFVPAEMAGILWKQKEEAAARNAYVRYESEPYNFARHIRVSE